MLASSSMKPKHALEAQRAERPRVPDRSWPACHHGTVMRFTSRTAAPPGTGSGMSVQGTLRSDRRLAMLLRRLQPGDIAVIDATDMDQATAEALANRGVVAVVNAAPCLSGRFPAQGPGVLLDAGIGLIDSAVDAVGADLGQGIGRGAIKDGGTATIVDGELSVRGRPVATGRVVTQTVLTDLLDASRDGLETQLQTFTHNSIEYLRREQGLLLHGQGIPELHTRFEGQGAVVVAADYDYRAELKRLRRYLRDQRPVMVGIDAGADALIESGFTPTWWCSALPRLLPSGSRPPERTRSVTKRSRARKRCFSMPMSPAG